MSVTVRIPGLAWDDMLGGSYGQDAASSRDAMECEEPGIVEAIHNARTVRAGRGFTALVELTNADDADGLFILADALLLGARDNSRDDPEARSLASALSKTCDRLADAKAALTREEAAR